MTNLEIIELNDKEYYLVKKIKIDNSEYYILINTNNNKDLIVRKLIKENNEEYLVKLANYNEFDLVMSEYIRLETKHENI